MYEIRRDFRLINMPIMTPTPTLVTANTFDPSSINGNMSLSGGDLTATAGDNNDAWVYSYVSKQTGKYYFEIRRTGSTDNFAVGISSASGTSSPFDPAEYAFAQTADAFRYPSFAALGSATGLSANDYKGIAIDLDAELWWQRVTGNTQWNGNGAADPATGAGGWDFTPMSKLAHRLFFWASDSGDSIILNVSGSFNLGSAPSGFGTWTA